MEIVTAEQMRQIDRRAIDDYGVSGLQLMESAGRGVAEALVHDYGDDLHRGVTVLCGKGNNGGDGFVAARYLWQRGIPVVLLFLGARGSIAGDAALQLESAIACGLPLHECPDEATLATSLSAIPPDGLVVDALLGTGASGGARGLVRAAIEAIGQRSLRIVAIDLPSGLDADPSVRAGPVVSAERTYTLCRPKLAIVSGIGADLAGRWRVIPIGIPDEAVTAEKTNHEWIDSDLVRRLVRPRRVTAHKGSLGHLLVIAGGPGKTGAAVLVARGALRAGVGLVTVALPGSALPIVAGQLAEAMTDRLPENSAGALCVAAIERARSALGEAQALALGPGLGRDQDTIEFVRLLVAELGVPTVLDADGLNAFASLPNLERRLATVARCGLVLTPHPGEAARLLGLSSSQIQDDRWRWARELAAQTGGIVVLKGHRTIVAHPDGRAAINGSGNPGMAVPGSGDVLTGAIGAALARGLPPWDAARLCVFVHGQSADRRVAECGIEGLLASEIADGFPLTLRALTDDDPTGRGGPTS